MLRYVKIYFDIKMSDKIKHAGKCFSAGNYYIFVASKIDNGTVLIMSFPWRNPFLFPRKH